MNKNRFYFREAQTQSDFEKMFALRYQVYCIENNWLLLEKYPDHWEKDEYDACSKHFIAEDEAGEIAGTIRLILSDRLQSGQLLPIGKHPSVSADSLDFGNCAEISRLVVDKRLRRGDIALGLYRILYQYSSRYQLDYWYVAVDEIFLKILQKLGFPFQSFAKPGKYMGDTIPAKLQVTFVERHLTQKNKPLADWFQASPYCLEENRLMSKFLSRPDKNRCVFNPVTSEGLFSRNWAFIPQAIQDKLATTRLFIAGAGLGSVIAERAARTGFGKFIFADGDSVALSNLNRQVFVRKDISCNKARATSDLVLAINEQAEVEIMEEYLTPDTLKQPIIRSDLVVNTIDFDHPAFLDCNKQAQTYGKPVLFPLNIGWGGALFVFTPDSPLLDDFLGLAPNTPCSYNQIKNMLIRKIICPTLPDYLIALVDVFESPDPEDWRNDPQLAIGSAISASLSVTAAVSIVANTPVKTAPDFIYIDFYELIRKP